MKKWLLVQVLTVFCSGILWASSPDSVYLREHYLKREVMVPMRDGVNLFTSIYIPKPDGKKHPILVCRTPYSCSPYGEDAYNERLWTMHFKYYIKKGYIMVYQDVRGRYMSGGVFEDVRPLANKKDKKSTDESTDAYDTVDWLLSNVKDNNGKVGFFGSSYPGFYSTMAAAGGHPAVKAVSPQAPVTDWFAGDDFHHNGAFAVMDAFTFYYGFGLPRPEPVKEHGKRFKLPVPDNYSFFLANRSLPSLTKMMGSERVFWNRLMEHSNYDSFWKERDARKACKNLKPAIMITGGLFDAEDCYGAWKLFEAIHTQSPGTKLHLVMGPWSHGGWYRSSGENLGNIRMGGATARWYQEQAEHPFFDHYLLDDNTPYNLPRLLVFDTGEKLWNRFSNWPPETSSTYTLYFEEKGMLSTTLPVHDTGYDAYISDPGHPVPYADGVHEARTLAYMTDDQRFASRRPDVLTYRTEPLTEDISICGEPEAVLFTSASTSDADYVVKLIDVFPDDASYDTSDCCPGKKQQMGGYQMLVRAEIMRGRFRKSLEQPVPMNPGVVDTVQYNLPAVMHTFKKGHSIMVQVQSSWFPLFDMNPQQFTDIYHCADADFIKSEIRLMRNSGMPSRMKLQRYMPKP